MTAIPRHATRDDRHADVVPGDCSNHALRLSLKDKVAPPLIDRPRPSRSNGADRLQPEFAPREEVNRCHIRGVGPRRLPQMIAS